ncbi:hypothetical protein [Aquimarina pacifica]|uniref:hypothetical protein n=1 Tax=Aquimarina pacifica TaxID=1296415 RepID=UPI00047297C4|nr:hypothetical protein [Aquimarina pacifica]
MEQYLQPLGINEFENRKYIFEANNLNLGSEVTAEKATVEIDTWELKGGYRYLNITINLGDSFIEALGISYKENTLFDKTKIADSIGKNNFHTIDLDHWDGISELECYFYTENHDDSVHVLTELIKMLGDLELVDKQEKDLSEVTYEPFTASNMLKEHLLANVTDFSSDEEIEKVAVDFMEAQGQAYRSDLYSDSKLIYQEGFWGKEESPMCSIHEYIEEFIEMNFEEDEIFFDDFF